MADGFWAWLGEKLLRGASRRGPVVKGLLWSLGIVVGAVVLFAYVGPPIKGMVTGPPTLPSAGTTNNFNAPNSNNVGNCPGCTLNAPPKIEPTDLAAALRLLLSDASVPSAKPIDETSHPGWEVSFLLVLGDPIPGRENFIFDRPLRGHPDRISIFIDQEQSLVFRMKDGHGVTRAVSARPSFGTFRFRSILYLVCQYAVVGPGSTMRIMVNMSDIAQRNESQPLYFSKDLAEAGVTATIGADFEGKNGGVFSIARFTHETHALSRDEEQRALQFTDSLYEFGKNFSITGFNGDGPSPWVVGGT